MALLGIAAAAHAGLVSLPGLYHLSQARGWLPGATSRRVAVTEKWRDETDPDHELFWIAWGEGNIREAGGHRIELPSDRFDALAVGDSITIVRVPGVAAPRTEGDWSSGNVDLLANGVFLTIEVILVWQLWRALAARYRSAKEVTT